MDWEDYAEWTSTGMSDQTSFYSFEDIYQEFKKRFIKEMQEEANDSRSPDR